MAYRLKFSGRALREIGEAFDWYEEQSEGLGFDLSWLLNFNLNALSKFRFCTQKLFRAYAAHSCHGFHMAFFYTVKNELVHVLAVIHNARNPRRWPHERAR